MNLPCSNNSQFDVVILSNGPGEVLSWVRPVVQQLREQLPHARISVLLCRCSHASGQEYQLVTRTLHVDRALRPEHFLRFLIRGKTPDAWDWHQHGVVLFLGGDQAFTWLIGKRLGYRRIVYTEKHCRWLSMNDVFLCRQPHFVARTLWPPLRRKVKVIGDLLQDAIASPTQPLQHHWRTQSDPNKSLTQVSILPGSKPIKLKSMIPYCLALADRLQATIPAISMVLFLPPNVSLQQLADYASDHNTWIPIVQGQSATLHADQNPPALITANGTRITIHQAFPAHHQLAVADLAITSIGTITDELGKLGAPMIVLSPLMLYQLGLSDNFTQWDGLIGLVARLPIIGLPLLRLVNRIAARKAPLLAWPNIHCGREVVPEIRQGFPPAQLAPTVIELLQDHARLQQIRRNLEPLKSAPGAATTIVDEIKHWLEEEKTVDQQPTAP